MSSLLPVTCVAGSPIERGMFVKKDTSGNKVLPLDVDDAASLFFGVALGKAYTGHTLDVSTVKGVELLIYMEGLDVVTEGCQLAPSKVLSGAASVVGGTNSGLTAGGIATATAGAPATTGALARACAFGVGGAASTAPVNTTVKTTNYTARVLDCVVCNPVAASFNVQLPSASGAAGGEIRVANIAASGVVTVLPAGSENIFGDASYAVNSYGSATFRSDGTNWMVF